MTSIKRALVLAFSIGALVSISVSSAVAQSAAALSEEEELLETIEVVGQLSRFGASKSKLSIIDTSRSLSIETSSQFIDKGAANLSQTASYMAGVSAETFGFSTRGDWIHVRGLNIPRYRDSIQELFGSYNTTRAEVYTLEQVEVLKGPASVLYGQGSPGGVVNYVSKAPRAERRVELLANIGSFNRHEAGIDATGAIPGTEQTLQYRMVAQKRHADTQVDFVNDDTLVLMPSVSWEPSDMTRLTLLGLYQDTQSDSGSQFVPVEGTLLPLVNGSFIDQDVYVGEPEFNRFNTQSTQLTLLYEHIFNDVFSVNATALWREGDADYHQAWPTFTGGTRYLNGFFGSQVVQSDTIVPRSFYQADNHFEQIAFDIRVGASFETGVVQHEFLLGAQVQQVETDNNLSYFFGGGALAGDFSYTLDLNNPVYTGAPDQAQFDDIYIDNPEQNVDDLGLYITDNIAIGDLRLTLGARFDEVDNDTGAVRQSDSEVSLNAGVLYRFGSGVTPYLSYAESFETVVGSNLEGDALQPEFGEQIEFGIKYEPASFPALLTLAYFDIDISNLPNPNSLPLRLGQQLGKSSLNGVELEAKMQIGDLYLQAALSTLDATDPNGFKLSSEPDRLASLWLSWRPQGKLQGFKAGLGIRHVGRSVSESDVLRYETPDYTLGDLMLGYELNERWDFALNVRNLADVQYLTSCLTRGDCFPGVRRAVAASIRFRL